MLKQIKVLLILLAACLPYQTFSQEKVWYFGNEAGIDFNGTSAVAITDGTMNVVDNAAAISDFTGNLLFYTDGMNVWDRNHSLMPNGTGLMGESSNGQGSLIVQRPGTDLFYIFTVGQYNSTNGFRYHIVELSQNGGFGDVISKNILLLSPSTERLDAVYNELTNSYWIITHGWNSNDFYSYELTQFGFNPVPVISPVGTVHTGGMLGHYNTMGQLCISPTKTKLVCGIYSDGVFELFDFDLNTGVISNPVPLGGFNNAWGAAFSPDGTKLYVSEWMNTEITQLDISSGIASVILNTATVVGHGTGPGGSYQAGYLQLAPDDKIYGAVFDDDYLLVINSPNQSGLACNLVDNGFFLNGKKSQAGLCRAVSSRSSFNSINETAVEKYYSVFPNPFVDEFNLTSHTNRFDGFNYSIFNSVGAEILNGKLSETQKEIINISGMPAGIYHLKISGTDIIGSKFERLIKLK